MPPEPLTTDEVERLIKAATDRYPTGRRNRALLVCLWRGGLRCQEMLDLKPADIDTTAGTIRVLHGKGDKARLVGLDSGAVALIQRWLDKRATLGMNGDQRAFCTLKGRPLQSSYVRALLPRLAKRAGIDKIINLSQGVAQAFDKRHAPLAIAVPPARCSTASAPKRCG